MTADDITREPEPTRRLTDLQPDDADGALSADFDGHDLPPAPDLPDDRFSSRELSWLEFNARVLGAGRGPAAAAAGADEVPRDLRQQPGRVLHGPGRRAEAAAGHGPRRSGPRTGGPPRETLDPGVAGAPRSWSPGTRRFVAGRHRAGAGRRRASGCCAGSELDAAERSPAGRVLPGPGVPGPHPARGRPVAPVPVHQRALAQPGRARPRPGAPGGRPSGSPGSRCPTTSPGSWT